MVKEIAAYLDALSLPIKRTGFESCTLSQHLYYGFPAEGFDVVRMEARRVSAAMSAMCNKTDRNDARGITQILRTGWFCEQILDIRDIENKRVIAPGQHKK